jgi:hypothetical protein
LRVQVVATYNSCVHRGVALWEVGTHAMRDTLPHSPQTAGALDGAPSFGAPSIGEPSFAAAPDRLPWGSAALATGGLCLVLWAVLIAAVAALV